MSGWLRGADIFYFKSRTVIRHSFRITVRAVSKADDESVQEARDRILLCASYKRLTYSDGNRLMAAGVSPSLYKQLIHGRLCYASAPSVDFFFWRTHG